MNPTPDPPKAEVHTHPLPAPSAPRASLWHNAVSLLGLFIAAMALLLILTFALFSVLNPAHNPYVDVVGYLVLPGVMVFGLLVVPVGMILQYRAIRKRGPVSRWIGRLVIDLHNPRHRRLAVGFSFITFFVVLPVIGVSGYHGYHYTESAEFCAKVCHAVMEPQATTYEFSPHARVPCAECHIGAGADWFVKSKLSGLAQVWAVFRNTYPRPIPPAITALRPARETCEECHWPAKFFGSQLKEVVHFSSDEANTRRVVRMLLKTGGADESIGRVEGIHMHMALSGYIEYIASDPHLQDIPWVRYVTADGREIVYRSDGVPPAAPPPDGLRRRIDCMDCHNRAAHHFFPPQQAVNLYLNGGLIDATLPFIKREVVAGLTPTYPDRASAEAAIRSRIEGFYQTEYPDVWNTRRSDVQRAAERVAELYHRNSFPDMGADWRTYVDNIGHLSSPGCFRCHDGRHVDAAGRPINSACDVCHTFLIPDEGSPGSFTEGPFRHSMSLRHHENLRCNQCHTGGELPTCRDCHASGQWLKHYGKERFEQTE
jgi:hypothetical protein